MGMNSPRWPSATAPTTTPTGGRCPDGGPAAHASGEQKTPRCNSDLFPAAGTQLSCCGHPTCLLRASNPDDHHLALATHTRMANPAVRTEQDDLRTAAAGDDVRASCTKSAHIRVIS